MPLTEPGRYAITRPAGSWGGEAATLGRAPRTYTTTLRPPVRPPRPRPAIEPPMAPMDFPGPDLLAEATRLEELQRERAQMERAAEIASLQEEETGYGGSIARLLADLTRGRGEIETERGVGLEALGRSGELQRGLLARMMGSRNLNFSGIERGAAGRGERDLLLAQGGIERESAGRLGSLESAAAREQAELESRRRAARARIDLLSSQPVV
jgi:hypothetical protein